jgi:hypothetical protein
MDSLNHLKAFLSNEVIHIPAILPLSAASGYAICGAKCAGIATASSVVDLGLKYFNISDSYYLTSSLLGSILGNQISSPFIAKYNAAIFQTESSPVEHNIQVSVKGMKVIKVEYLSKIFAIGVGAIGVLFSNFISKFENWLLDNETHSSEMKEATIDNCSTEPELVQIDNIINPEL